MKTILKNSGFTTKTFLVTISLAAMIMISSKHVCFASDDGPVSSPTTSSDSSSSDTSSDTSSSSSTTDSTSTTTTSTSNTVTKLVAFGDSITAGFGGVAPYPTKLRGLVGSCYTIINSGVAGEMTRTGVSRINRVLTTHKPKTILIMEGANDAFWGISPSTVKFNLGFMIDTSRARGATPIISTITPNTEKVSVTATIPASYNPQIKLLASQKSVTLVDSYAAVAANWSNLTLEGLHPNDAGSLLIAQAFSAALPCSGGSGGGGCFIATAAFGSSIEPQVTLLKRFRDQFLLKSDMGRLFVKAYYHYSPPIAEFISRHDTLKMAVRATLYPLIGFSYLVLDASLLERLSIFMLLLGMAGSALWLARQRRRTVILS